MCFGKFENIKNKEIKEDREKDVREFLYKSLSLLEECYVNYKKDSSYTSKNEIIQVKTPTEISDYLYENREIYEKFILKSYIILHGAILSDTKEDKSSLLAFSLRTVLELFFKKLIFFIEEPNFYNKEKVAFILADVMNILRDDFPKWFSSKSDDIEKNFKDKEIQKILEIVSEIEKNNYKGYYPGTIARKAKDSLKKNRDNLVKNRRFNFANIDQLFYDYSGKIHGNPFMMKTFLDDSERVKYHGYIILYEASLNCLSLLAKSEYICGDLNKKVEEFLNNEEESGVVEGKLRQGYPGAKKDKVDKD